MNRFVTYVGVGAGSSFDILLTDGMAVLASMKDAKSVMFSGGLLKREVPLRPGLNMVGVTRSGSVETVGDFAAFSSVPLRVIALRYDSAGNARF